MQGVTSFMNAVLVCVPLLGGLAAHWVSGGMTGFAEVIEEGFDVSGLLEYVFGKGKDFSRCATEPAVAWFLDKWKKVPENATWKTQPEENRIPIIRVAEYLNL